MNRTIPLTAELVYEWLYRRTERLGLMAEDRAPSLRQAAIAEAEANEWLTVELSFAWADRQFNF